MLTKIFRGRLQLLGNSIAGEGRYHPGCHFGFVSLPGWSKAEDTGVINWLDELAKSHKDEIAEIQITVTFPPQLGRLTGNEFLDEQFSVEEIKAICKDYEYAIADKEMSRKDLLKAIRLFSRVKSYLEQLEEERPTGENVYIGAYRALGGNPDDLPKFMHPGV